MAFLSKATEASELAAQSAKKTSNSSAGLSNQSSSTQSPRSYQSTQSTQSTQSSVSSQVSSQSNSDQLPVHITGNPGSPVRTIFDDLFDAISQNTSYTALSNTFSVNSAQIDEYCRLLELSGLVKVTYSLVFFSAPLVSRKKEPLTSVKKLVLHNSKRLVEQYTVESNSVSSDVLIWSIPQENTPIYEIIPHDIGFATAHVLDMLLDELAKQIVISGEDVIDPEKIEAQKRDILTKSKRLISSKIPCDALTLDILAGTLLHKVFGTGDLEVIMADNWLEEVAINGDSQPLSLYHKKYGWLKTTKFFDREADIYNLASQIARRVGKQINALTPIMDAHLETGDRVAATLFPISTEGDTITIRRFSRNPWTIIHMIDSKIHTMSKEVMAFLWLAMQYELNFLVVGGTASGKTSILNTLCALINPTNRVISIEDTREISLPKQLHWNWVPMVSRSANTEGQGEVSMLDLIVASLRMRPDRIVVGEIRRKQQAEALFEAMHTGHSVCATMHADTAEQVKHRLIQPPIEIPENELEALQLVVVQYRDRRRGVRRTLEVAEVLPGGSDEKIKLNYLYRWRPRNDAFAKEDDSIRVVEDLNLHTGMTGREIQNDLDQKEQILEWMLDNNVTDVDKVGHIMRIYYKSPKILLDAIRDKAQASDFFDEHTFSR
jgi:archaeal flagellar protein FlaI